MWGKFVDHVVDTAYSRACTADAAPEVGGGLCCLRLVKCCGCWHLAGRWTALCRTSLECWQWCSEGLHCPALHQHAHSCHTSSCQAVAMQHVHTTAASAPMGQTTSSLAFFNYPCCCFMDCDCAAPRAAAAAAACRQASGGNRGPPWRP